MSDFFIFIFFFYNLKLFKVAQRHVAVLEGMCTAETVTLETAQAEC